MSKLFGQAGMVDRRVLVQIFFVHNRVQGMQPQGRPNLDKCPKLHIFFWNALLGYFTEPESAAAGQLPAEGREQEPGEGGGQAEQMMQSQQEGGKDGQED